MRFLVSFLVVFFLIFIVALFINKYLTKWLGVEKKESISETPGKNMDRWGRGIILCIFLCALPMVLEYENILKWYWVLFLNVLIGFQSVLEWKYLKPSKQYLITLTYLIFALVMVFGMNYFTI
ncbi:DUF4181 domain-containing protein [Peribacillus sp. NPDC097295]|uniref:DUF4181 domain-containing protein n=1 Tax=Peribacillus sp. NPDC097295 TaxID=3364402 RepID=UPI0037F71E83